MKRGGLILCAALALAVTSGAALANQPDFEIKGLRIGMSEAEFKKLNPKAKCESSRREKDWDSSIARVRMCSVSDFTMATRKADSSLFAFYDGRLGSWNASFYESYGRELRDALASKFGPPRMEPNAQGALWQFDKATMYLGTITGSSALLIVRSDMSDAEDRKVEEIKRRKGKADL
jgi:hypothetical protein